MAVHPPLIAVVGPTAVGKSEAALELASHLGGEILSADSMQVYIGMDVGTAKPTPAERLQIRHHGLDLADPRVNFSVAEYCKTGWEIIRNHEEQGVPLVVCGGTGLYLKALFEGLTDAPPPDPAFRNRIESQAETEGCESVYRRLLKVDPEAARRIHPNDLKRIVRALEIQHATGLSKTAYESAQHSPPWRDRVQWIGFRRPWPELDDRIQRRVRGMLLGGLEDEVRRLLRIGCRRGGTAMQGLGYKEAADYIEGLRSLEETENLIAQRTRRFARRQMTWFRPNRRIKWFDASPARSTASIAASLVQRVASFAQSVVD